MNTVWLWYLPENATLNIKPHLGLTLETPFSIDSLQTGLSTQTAEEMEALGMWLAQHIPDDSILTLSGTLGVGKTTLVRGIARGLGIKETVSSPTFNVYNIFRGDSRQLIHMDAYRLDSTDDLDALMLEDLMEPPWLWVIEWPENLKEALPDSLMALELSIQDERHNVRLLGSRIEKA